MSNQQLNYETDFYKAEKSIKFFFTSKGKQDIVKVIEYSFITRQTNRDIYNLGFGDYDMNSNEIVDHKNSNNGDAYRVFNTVLNTVPVFFQNFPKAILLVQGSDSRSDFVDVCKSTCAKNCKESCRKINQRISIYQKYLDKNHAQLNIDFDFQGGCKKENGTSFEPYIQYKKYDALLIFRKNS